MKVFFFWPSFEAVVVESFLEPLKIHQKSTKEANVAQNAV